MAQRPTDKEEREASSPEWARSRRPKLALPTTHSPNTRGVLEQSKQRMPHLAHAM